jgi:hypothetical protein
MSTLYTAGSQQHDMQAVNGLESDSKLPISLKLTELKQQNYLYHNETETKN